MVLVVEAVHPGLEVTVTEKLVVAEGFTVIVCVVAPFDHKYVPPAGEAVITAVAPVHIVPSCGVVPDVSATVVETATGLTVITLEVVAVQPALVTVQVNVDVVVGDTVMDCVVAPLDHK